MKKSLIKWAGGKSHLISRIKQDVDTINPEVYMEPFCGSAVISINMPKLNIICSDLNKNLINFFNQVKKGLIINPNNYKLTKEEYHNYRKEYNALKNLNSHERRRAELFYYLNKAGFNGLYRENAAGEFNTPYGNRSYIPPLSLHKSKLSHIQFKHCSYKDLDVPKNALIYLDPPYDTEFNSYIEGNFDWDEQEKLIKWAVSLNTPFIISNQAVKRIQELYKDYNLYIELLECPRKIAGNGNRKPALEVYCKNFKGKSQYPQQLKLPIL